MNNLTNDLEVEGNTFATLAPRAWVPQPLDLPAVDVFEEGDAVVVKIELPGLKRDEIEVEVAGDYVMISGNREKEEGIAEKDYYRCERAAGAFRSSVALPFEVEPGKATAQLEDGVLEVRAPRKGGAQRAKIAIA